MKTWCKLDHSLVLCMREWYNPGPRQKWRWLNTAIIRK
jgi:hypothetical protein